jgi:hypothetical protein
MNRLPLLEQRIREKIQQAKDEMFPRNMLGLPEAKWEEKEEGGEGRKQLEQYPARDSKQRTLSDFIN